MAKPMNITNRNNDKIFINASANSVVLTHSGVTKLETTTAGVNILGAIYVNGSEFTGGGGDGGSSLQTRIDKVGVSASLTDGATGNVDIVGFKGYALLSITTDKAAWVRIYSNGAARTADASRLEVTDPTPDAGVIAEVITTGAETVLMSPSSMGFNMEATPTTNIPCAVTNKSGSTGTVSVTLNVLQLEA